MSHEKQAQAAPTSDPAVGCSAWLGRLSHVSTLEELQPITAARSGGLTMEMSDRAAN